VNSSNINRKVAVTDRRTTEGDGGIKKEENEEEGEANRQ